MKNYVKIDCENRKIIMDRTFAKNAKVVGSEEYNLLQTARKDYTGFDVVTRTIKRNSQKKCYHGLTYDYMEKYIMSHEKSKERKKEFDELRLIAACHSKRYPTIKKWFLEQYPEVAEFGMSKDDETSAAEENTEAPAGDAATETTEAPVTVKAAA